MASVIRFPGSSGGKKPFGMGAAPPGTAVSEPPPPQEAPPQAGAAAPVAPAAQQIQARLHSTLELARKATLKLVGGAVPGTIEVGLFNQFGILQNALAQLASRAAQATGDAELYAIGQDLESVEKQTNDYAAAVDAALASAPASQTLAPRNPSQLDKRTLLLIGGGVTALAVGTGVYLYFRKPARRKKLAGFFEPPAPKKRK